MRGLSEEEADKLARSAIPVNMRPYFGELTHPVEYAREIRVGEALKNRGLVRIEVEWPTRYHFKRINYITPLGRIALACHAALKISETFK